MKSFLRSVVYNMKYVKDYGKLVAPLHEATKGTTKNGPIHLTSDQLKSFTALVLHIPNHRTDASNFAIGGTLLNIVPDGGERVIAYYGRKLSSCELNYGVRENMY